MSNVLVSPITAVAIAVGAVISFLYLRYMWLVLQRVAQTIDDPDDERPDSFAYSFIGAIVAVAASWAAIAAYGLGPQFLYAGIILAFASPIAVAYTFYRELHD